MSKKPEAEVEPKLCEKCGTLMIQDDKGKWYCPNCDTEIDWGIEEDEEE